MNYNVRRSLIVIIIRGNNYSQHKHNKGKPEGFKIRSSAICCPFQGLRKSVAGWRHENEFSWLPPLHRF